MMTKKHHFSSLKRADAGKSEGAIIMKNRILMLTLVILVASSLAAGCERPAPLPTNVATSTIPFPIPDRPTVISEIGTQTAVAQTPPVVAITTTPVPGQTTQPGQTIQPTQTPPLTKPTQPPAATKAPVVVGPTATPKPVVVVPSATPGRPATYTIQAGDTFYCLARRFNLNVAEFLGLNGLGNNSLAVIGQVVHIPATGTWSGAGPRALKSHPDTYTVQGNEPLNKIACIYGDVDPSAILYANNLSSASDIQAGMTLNIP
jgi:LysM repeat protein